MREPIFCCDVYVDVFKHSKTSLTFSFKKVIKNVPVVGTENDKIVVNAKFVDMIHREVYGDHYQRSQKNVNTVVATRIFRKSLLSYSADNAGWNLTDPKRIGAIMKLIQARNKSG
jgi:hypothetical protein